MKNALVIGASLAVGLGLLPGCRSEKAGEKDTGQEAVSLSPASPPAGKHQAAAMTEDPFAPIRVKPSQVVEHNGRKIEIVAVGDAKDGKLRAWRPDGTV